MKTIILFSLAILILSCNDSSDSNTEVPEATTQYTSLAEKGNHGPVKRIVEKKYYGDIIKKFDEWQSTDTNNAAITIYEYNKDGNILREYGVSSPSSADTSVTEYYYDNGVLSYFLYKYPGKADQRTDVKWLDDTTYFTTTLNVDGSISDENKTKLRPDYHFKEYEKIFYDDGGQILLQSTKKYLLISDSINITHYITKLTGSMEEKDSIVETILKRDNIGNVTKNIETWYPSGMTSIKVKQYEYYE